MLPIHADAVASIVGVADVWALFFGLMAIHQTARYMSNSGSPHHLLIIVVMLVGCLLSKESGLVFAAVVALLAFQGPTEKRDRKRAFLITALSLALVGVFFLLRAIALESWESRTFNEVDNALATRPWADRIPMALVIFGKYLRLALVGYPLSADYSTNAIPIETVGPRVALGGVLLVALISYGVVKRKESAIRLLLLWFLGSFLFISNILALLPALFAERLFYGPSAALCFLLASIISSIKIEKYRKAFIAVGILYLGSSLALAASHAHAWRSSESISRVTVEHTPTSARGHFWMAQALARAQGDPQLIEEHTRRAIELVPAWGKPYGLLGASIDQQGRPREALEVFQIAIELAPHEAEIADLFIQFLIHYEHIEQARAVYRMHAAARGGLADPSVTVPH